MTSQEYEIQHFEFSANQISLERQYVIKIIIQDVLKPFVEVLAKSTSTEGTVDLLHQEKAKVVQKILAAFREKLKDFEQLDRNNFTIPENVLLLKDYDHTKNYKVEDEERLDQEIVHLKQLFLENSIMIAALTMENNQYASIEGLLQEEMAVHSQVQESLNAVNIKKSLDVVASIHKLSERQNSSKRL